MIMIHDFQESKRRYLHHYAELSHMETENKCLRVFLFFYKGLYSSLGNCSPFFQGTDLMVPFYIFDHKSREPRGENVCGTFVIFSNGIDDAGVKFPQKFSSHSQILGYRPTVLARNSGTICKNIFFEMYSHSSLSKQILIIFSSNLQSNQHSSIGLLGSPEIVRNIQISYSSHTHTSCHRSTHENI